MKRILASLLLALPLFAADKPAPPPDLANPPADAVRGEDGLISKTLANGTGTEHLAEDGFASLRYTVWKSDGTLVQDVAAPNSVFIAKKKMIPGWGVAVQQMVPGEKRRIWIPPALAAGKLKEGEMFVIDTELLDVIPNPAIAPPDVHEAPTDATMTASGITYRVLRPGTGSVHPKRSQDVIVHYTGWTSDGQMFDSSYLHGEPAQFNLMDVIKGWTEGLTLMVEGEKTRFWIPQRLAYRGERNKPKGMLIFDVELLKIVER
jgi:FKBP-type peptidyl-prolyl cis-trans isomerase